MTEALFPLYTIFFFIHSRLAGPHSTLSLVVISKAKNNVCKTGKQKRETRKNGEDKDIVRI